MRLPIPIVALAAMLVQSGVLAQSEPIYLTNPSFEDMPRHSKPPRGWYDCGFEGESPPDVQPSGTFSVTKPPFEGNTYLGMVVRDNDTWEAVSQRLNRPLERGQCYEFSIFLSRSELYVSTSRITEETANYTTPAKLRIYGGTGYCDKRFLLGETSLVKEIAWQEYKFKFEPIDNYTYLILEVFYKTPTLFPYNGNVLIDNASPITPVPCEETLAVEEVEPQPATPQPERRPPPETVRPAPREEPASSTAEVEPAPRGVVQAEDKVDFSRLNSKDLREGQTLRIDNLFFEADKSIINEESYAVLDEVFTFLARNRDVVVEIGGHTNGLPPDWYCDRLSAERAKAVADYLTGKGITRDRLQFKGYGKRKPIASNETKEGQQKNQRVEVKIVGFNG